MKKRIIKSLYVNLCLCVIVFTMIMLRGNDSDAVQMDMLNDNVEALVSGEQIIVGALCAWDPSSRCKYKSDTGEVYYLVGILVPW